jgi:hypothetical protein
MDRSIPLSSVIGPTRDSIAVIAHVGDDDETQGPYASSTR